MLAALVRREYFANAHLPLAEHASGGAVSIRVVSIAPGVEMYDLVAATKELLELLGRYSDQFKTIGAALGIGFALLSFFLSRYDKAELKKITHRRGAATVKFIEARKSAARAEENLKAVRADLRARENKITKLENDIELLTKRADELWKIREGQPFADYRDWMRDPRCAKFVVFGNLKGGVGKTTLSANYAAYLSTKLKKRVLVVDLDYQGSLSNMLLQAIGETEVESRIDTLLAANAPFTMIQHSMADLRAIMPGTQLVPASYELNRTENRLLFESLLKDQNEIDVRYRLAHSLLRPEVSQYFDVVVMDMAPRMSLAAVNALVTAHRLIVPTKLDRLSGEAVGQFLTNMQAIKRELQLDIDLGGIVGTMTTRIARTAEEDRVWGLIGDASTNWLNSGVDQRIEPTIPNRAAISRPRDDKIAYLGADSDGHGRTVADLLDPVFEEISTRIGIIKQAS